MPTMMDPTYTPTPRTINTDPMRGLQDPNYTPNPKVGFNPTGGITPTNINDPRMDPRNIRARQNRIITPPPPVMGYGPAVGTPTAGLMPAPTPPPTPQMWAGGSPNYAEGGVNPSSNVYQRFMGTGPYARSPWAPVKRNPLPAISAPQPVMSGMASPQRLSVGMRDPSGLMPRQTGRGF